MEVSLNNNGKKGSFFIESDNQKVAEMTFVWAGSDRIIIDHTEVSPEFNGKGLGKQMVKSAVDFAREKQISIVPLCPFANSVFKRMPEWKDVL